MPSFIFALEDDFEGEVAAGGFRQADPLQAVRQDLNHLLEEAEVIGDPQTEELDGEVRAQLVAMLGNHPYVASIEGIEATVDGETNTWRVSVFINGRTEPISGRVSNVGG